MSTKVSEDTSLCWAYRISCSALPMCEVRSLLMLLQAFNLSASSDLFYFI
ncbi:MAG TPA: hypothetical protein V6C90_08055 [Coleofasciculaceae cyanobacterium]